MGDDAWRELEALYRKEQPGLVRLAWLLVDDRAVAEELVQEAFVRLHRRGGGIDNPGGYLRTIVVNLARGHHRRLQTVRDHPAEAPATADPPALPRDLEEVWLALDALPVRRRQALILRYYADLSIDDIAELLGARPGTVRSLIHRGLASLQEVLAP